MRVLVVIGTRPEAIKLHPFIKYAKNHMNVDILMTMQQRMSLDYMKEKGHELLWDEKSLKNIDFASYDTSYLLAEFIKHITNQLKQRLYDFIIVQGDTTSTLAGALAGMYADVPVVHIEAGLRSYNYKSPFPEEYHRCLVSKIARYHFAPTKQAYDVLCDEEVSGCVYEVGNTGIDSLMELMDDKGCSSDGYVLVTLHRAENRKHLSHIFKALNKLTDDGIQIKVVTHPHPDAREAAKELSNRVDIYEPLNQEDFVELLRKATTVVTDSGGVIEEAVTLGKPLVIMRSAIERTEAWDSNAPVRLVVPTQTGMMRSFVLDDIQKNKVYPQCSVFGNGKASQEIVSHLLDIYETNMV